MAMFPKRYSDVVQRLRVPSGFVLLAAFVWASDPSLRSLVWGLPVAIAGLWLRAWAAGHLAKNERLATSGPYRWIRNPLYAGTLITAFGLVLASRSAALAMLFSAVFLLVYLPVIEQEESKLRQLFPEYDEYAEKVPVLLPLAPPVGDASQKFRPDLYRRNQEWKALLGFLLAAALLAWKATS